MANATRSDDALAPPAVIGKPEGNDKPARSPRPAMDLDARRCRCQIQTANSSAKCNRPLLRISIRVDPSLTKTPYLRLVTQPVRIFTYSFPASLCVSPAVFTATKTSALLSTTPRHWERLADSCHAAPEYRGPEPFRAEVASGSAVLSIGICGHFDGAV